MHTTRWCTGGALVGFIGFVVAMREQPARADPPPNADDDDESGAIPRIGRAISRRSERDAEAKASIEHDAVVALANERGLVCTGALIAPRVVLTARHCLPLRTARFGPDPLRPREVTTIVGARTAPIGADVAVAVLAHASLVKPLPFRHAADPAVTSFVRLIGFGATDPRGERGMTNRHFVDVPFRAATCTPRDERRFGCRPDVELVLPRYFGNDTCAGDSGGPVLDTFEKGFRVMAITSRSVAGAITQCGDGGIYTRTAVVGSWLDAVVSNTRAE